MSKDLKDVREGASPFLRCPKKRNSNNAKAPRSPRSSLGVWSRERAARLQKDQQGGSCRSGDKS